MKITWKMWKDVFEIWWHAIAEVKIKYALEPVYQLIDEKNLMGAKSMLSKIMQNVKVPKYPEHQYVRIRGIIRAKEIRTVHSALN